MSLNYQLGGIAKWQETCYENHGTPEVRMKKITEAIIFGTMSVDLGRITVRNAEDFFERLDLIQREHNGLVYRVGDKGPEPVWITLEDVRRHVGLRTNVIDLRRAEWDKRQEDFRRRELARKAEAR